MGEKEQEPLTEHWKGQVLR